MAQTDVQTVVGRCERVQSGLCVVLLPVSRATLGGRERVFVVCGVLKCRCDLTKTKQKFFQ